VPNEEAADHQAKEQASKVHVDPFSVRQGSLSLPGGIGSSALSVSCPPTVTAAGTATASASRR
jgi:hypothetical protein